MRDSLDDIFTRALTGQTLFQAKEVLRTDYLPPKLPFREAQLTTMGQILAPLLRGSKCSNLLIYGKTGSGKTAVARYLLQRLQERGAAASTVRIRPAYCNTRVADSEYRALGTVAEQLGLRIPFTGLAISEVFQRVLTHVSAGSLTAVMVLDEIDALVRKHGDDLLYELTRANERLERGFVALVGISNDLQFKDFLDPRVLSSLSEEEVLFPPYTAEELRTILGERAAVAFHAGVVEDATVSLCAALAGSEHGDARRALDLLRVAGEVAEREGAGRVAERHVRLAAQRIEQDRLTEGLRSLPFQEKLVLLAIVAAGTATSTGQVYEQYRALCRRAGADVLTQRRVSGLISELDLWGLASSSVVSRGRYGRTKRIVATIPLALVRDVLGQDALLAPLLVA